MEKPLVSVIMPAYRCGGVIGEAIESVLAQDVSLELLVIDDCGGENLEEILQPYLSDPRVHLLRNSSNLGAAASRNRGVEAAEGDYVAFLDADDCWVSGKLKKQLEFLEKTRMVLCATARELMTPAGESTGRVIPVREQITYRDLLRHNCINCSSVVMKREVAREFPMCHEDSHEDYIMWLRVLKKYGQACAVNEPLLRYRLSNTGKSGSKLKSAKMTFMVYRYMGYSMATSIVLFVSYALHGVAKYARSYLGGRT